MMLTVRRALVEDEDEVVELWRACGLVTAYNDPTDDFRRANGGAASVVLVGTEVDGRIVGAVMAGDDGHRGWLYYVATRPGRQGAGIGRAMVGAGEAWLRGRGVPKVHLIVRETNAQVIGFYDHLGYEDTSRVLKSKWLREASTG